MPLASPRRLLPRALAVASLICTGLVLPGAISTAAAATCATTNIAQGKTATASSTENASFPASNAVDGNTGTRWSSAFSDPQWLEVDLGSSQSICQVTLNWETAYGKAFQIQTSTDNSTWTTIYSTTTGTGGTQNLAGHRHRPVHPDVRHRPRHSVRLLPLGIPGLRPRIGRRRHRLHRAVQHAELRPERLRLRPEHVQLEHPDHAQQRLQHAEAQPVRHPAVRAAVQAGHLQRRSQHRLLHLDPGPGAEPG